MFRRAVSLGLAIAGITFSTDAQEDVDSKAARALDEVAVYRTFLKGYSNGAPGVVNLADRTTRLDPAKDIPAGCLTGVSLERVSPRSTARTLKAEIVKELNVRLVNAELQMSLVRKNDPSRSVGQSKSVEKAVGDAFASGLLQVSGIVFDTTHRYAVLKLEFHCGGLCGHGGVLVFEKSGYAWQQSSRPCTNWVA